MKIGGNDITAMRVGSTAITAAYLGSTQVWTASAVAATLTIDSIGPQASSGNVPVTYTINASSLVEFLLVRDGTAAPVAADFNGGQTGPNVYDSGSQTLTIAGSSITLTGPDGLDGDFRLYALPANGGNSDIATSDLFALDSLAPVLSSPTGAQTGDTTASGGVTSDEAAGTLYAGVWPTASTPTAADIVAGTGASYHTDSTPIAGVNNFSASTLVAATAYKWHYVQDDAFSNRSNVVTSAEFTTGSSTWSFTAGDGQVEITSAPAAPTAPTVDSTGDGQVTLS